MLWCKYLFMHSPDKSVIFFSLNADLTNIDWKQKTLQLDFTSNKVSSACKSKRVQSQFSPWSLLITITLLTQDATPDLGITSPDSLHAEDPNVAHIFFRRLIILPVCLYILSYSRVRPLSCRVQGSVTRLSDERTR